MGARRPPGPDFRTLLSRAQRRHAPADAPVSRFTQAPPLHLGSGLGATTPTVPPLLANACLNRLAWEVEEDCKLKQLMDAIHLRFAERDDMDVSYASRIDFPTAPLE